MLLLVVVALVAMAPASAQVDFGVKGGVINTKMNFDAENVTSKSKLGWFVGPTLRVGLPLPIGVDIAALFNQKKLNINDHNFTQNTLEVPINARLNFGAGSKAGVYFAVGPQFGFNIGDSEFKWDEKESYESTFQLKKSQFSINLGAGVMLAGHLEVGFVYNIALGKTGELKNLKEGDKPKSKTWEVSAAYYF
jgi:hypothetical protein